MTQTAWIEEDELGFDFADLKAEAYENQFGKNAPFPTDDDLDEEINRLLDLRGERVLTSEGYLFDSETSRDEYTDTVRAAMANWAFAKAEDSSAC